MDNSDFHIEKRKSDGNRGSLSTSLTNWKLKADEYYRSSDVIYAQVNADYSKMISDYQIQQKTGNFNHRKYTPSISEVYILLVGYCLENMMKGIILFENPNLISNGKLNNKVKSHNLKHLAQMTGITFNDDENRLLDFITPCIEWLSKYPVPANAENSIGSYGHNINVVRDTFKAIHQKLNEKMKSTGLLKDHLINYPPA